MSEERTESTLTMRERAEEKLKSLAFAAVPEPSLGEANLLIHELRVHQIQLEMQNEELRRIQVELDATRARYFDLYELAPMGYCTLSGEGHILEANLTAATLLGVARGELVNQPINRFIAAEDQDVVYLHHKRLFETGEQQACELRMVKADKTIFWARMESTVAAGSAGGSVYRVMLSDITERRQVQDRLRMTADELARSNKDLEQFAYVASHDMKEPLRMITGFMTLLRERYDGQLDAKAAEYIRFAEEGGFRMQRLVDDLLAYACVGRNSRIEAVDVGVVVAEALKNLQAVIAEAGAKVMSDSLPIIRASKMEIMQLFQNLIANAIKFRRDGVSPEIHVSARREGENYLFRVRDNGIGIAPELGSKVFLIFERLHGGGQYPGTGIGLAICKKIVEGHGGKIWFEANEGEGATFCFTMPA
ncbi:MAG: ATP-binding protein [Kiritimatiellia bacterium]